MAIGETETYAFKDHPGLIIRAVGHDDAEMLCYDLKGPLHSGKLAEASVATVQDMQRMRAFKYKTLVTKEAKQTTREADRRRLRKPMENK